MDKFSIGEMFLFVFVDDNVHATYKKFISKLVLCICKSISYVLRPTSTISIRITAFVTMCLLKKCGRCQRAEKFNREKWILTVCDRLISLQLMKDKFTGYFYCFLYRMTFPLYSFFSCLIVAALAPST